MCEAPGPALRVTGLSKRYDHVSVLEDIELEVDRGTVFSLCGASGSGKTTTVRILAGLTGFDAGEIGVEGNVVRAGRAYPRGLYGRIGVVFQEMNLFPHLRAVENVRLALTRVRKLPVREAAERAMAELRRVGVAHRADHLPSRLSSGERQRVAIARALALDPLLLLLDEPTSNLHPKAVRGTGELISELAERGTTILLVSHNVRFARRFGHRFGVLSGGRLEVSEDPDLLDRLEGEG